MSDPLIVRLSGRVIGELLPGGSFRWNHSELEQVPLNAPLLSHSLPFGGDPREPGPFFGGLLPEGLGLDRLATEARVATNDLYGLLAEVGADVGGSVTVGEPRPPVAPVVIEEARFERVLERALGYLRGSNVGGGGSSASGVQPKVALTRDDKNEQWLIGRGSTPSTHILKPVPMWHAPALRAEAYMNRVAREIGLSSHDAWVEPAGNRAVLVVERYDRVRSGNGSIRRLHQEDAAQALALAWGGNDKYQSVNPAANLRAIALLLDRGRSLFSTAPSDRCRLLALVTLNVVAGNTDAHAKNFSFMLPNIHNGAQQNWSASLADAYDIVPQSLFNAEQSPYAMSIGGMSQPNEVTVAHLVGEAVNWGLPESDAERIVAATLRKIEQAVGCLELSGVEDRLPRYLLERVTNLQRGGRVWARALPPALYFSA